MATISLQPAPDPALLEVMWRGLEARADLSFFQSWTWMGCLVAERFPRPLLLRAVDEAGDVALGLFNRRRLSLHLGESGDPARDNIYIEHNGVVRARCGAPDLTALLRAVRFHTLVPRRLVLSGVDDAHRDAADALGGRVVTRRTHTAPAIDFGISGADWMAGISANTRQQLRRSARAYAGQGALRVARAESVAQAYEFLDALVALHRRTWEKRGKPGAFAQPFFRRFHRALIARGMARDEIDLLRVSAGDAVIGYLYNFRHRGRVLAYQSGFDYDAAKSVQKPGMTCHQMAIDMYAAAGALVYDFLAGDDRYKRSLANGQTALHWVAIYPAMSDFVLGRNVK